MSSDHLHFFKALSNQHSLPIVTFSTCNGSDLNTELRGFVMLLCPLYDTFE